MNDYQQQILDHYKAPRHWGKPSWTPTHTKKVENLTCGDVITVYILIENDTIKDISFEGEGCSISIASASLLSDKIIGMKLEEVNKLSYKDMREMLGIELTPTRQRCATLGMESVQEALADSN